MSGIDDGAVPSSRAVSSPSHTPGVPADLPLDEEQEEQLELVTQALMAMSAFDFSSYVPVRDADDALDDLATAARLAQRQLRTRTVSSSHLHTLLASMPNPTLLLDLAGRVLALNDSAEFSLGLAQELDFMAWLAVQLGESESRPLASWRQPIKTTCRLPAGERHYLFSAAPLLSHFDDVDGYVVVATDISEQVAIERALEQARQLAESHARARFSFLANISHEIRTPLNGILGFTQLMLDDQLDDQLREQVASIDSCGQHLLGLINEVLELSRIDAGQLVLHPAPFDLTHVLRDCMDGLRVAHTRTAVTLRLQLADDLPGPVLGDGKRFKQIVFNLLGNALKFTERGSVELAARVLDQDDDTVRVRIDFRDTGPGIAEHDQATLFEPFVQATPLIQRQYGGTGLGLAIVKQLVTAMGGRIGVQSRLGQGSTFWIELGFPRVAQPVPRVARDQPTLDDGLRGFHVLVVEDNAISRRVAARLLQRLGLRTTLAEDGLQALDRLAEQRFDVVLMDCQMPVMDGLTAVRELRARERGRRTPVLALTAHAFEEHRTECLAAGMDGYLRKPVLLDDLRQSLGEFLLAPPEES